MKKLLMLLLLSAICNNQRVVASAAAAAYTATTTTSVDADDSVDPAYWSSVELTDSEVQELITEWINSGSGDPDDPSCYTFAWFLQTIFMTTNESSIPTNVANYLNSLNDDQLSRIVDDDFTSIEDMMSNPTVINFMNYLWAFYESISPGQRTIVYNMILAVQNPDEITTNNTAILSGATLQQPASRNTNTIICRPQPPTG